MRLVVGLWVLWAAISPAWSQDTSALINAALDKQVNLTLNTVLPQAMETISKQTGVRLEAQPEVWELLPWGQDTNINARIENQTLRQALTALTRKLGLTFELRDEAVELQPMPALRRLARRSTVQELQALDLLTSTPVQFNTTRPTVRQIIEAVDGKLESLQSPFAVENRSGEVTDQNQPVSVPRTATLAEALEAITSQTRATWYPWGKSIVISSKEDPIRRQLEKQITVRYEGAELTQVLLELSQRSGVPFSIEPGAVQRVPPEARNVRLLLDNASIQDALEAIAGFTGLGYAINERGVYVWNQAAAAGSQDPVVGYLLLENGVLVPLNQSTAPPDVREYIQQKGQQQLQRLRQMMRDEGFTPSTLPATRPASIDEDL